MPAVNRFLTFKAFPTERPAYVDPTKVGAIQDYLENQASTLAGGKPTLVVAGTIVIVDGAPVHLAERAEIVRDAVEEYLKRVNPLILAN